MKQIVFVKKNWDPINDENFHLEKNLQYINRFTDSAASGKNLITLLFQKVRLGADQRIGSPLPRNWTRWASFTGDMGRSHLRRRPSVFKAGSLGESKEVKMS
jgi:hypothetical protein